MPSLLQLVRTNTPPLLLYLRRPLNKANNGRSSTTRAALTVIMQLTDTIAVMDAKLNQHPRPTSTDQGRRASRTPHDLVQLFRPRPFRPCTGLVPRSMDRFHPRTSAPRPSTSLENLSMSLEDATPKTASIPCTFLMLVSIPFFD